MSALVRLGVLGVVYVATAKVGLALEAVSGGAAAVWPPTGLALAALVLYGWRLWPGIAVGAFLVHRSAGVPGLVAGGMALGHTLAAVLGTVLLQRVVGFRPALERLQDVLGLVVLAAGLSTLVSATMGVTSGWLGGLVPTATSGEAWRTWWLRDALGDLVVAPLLFVWRGRGAVSLPRRGLAETLVLLGAVSGLSLLVFDVVAPALPVSRSLVVLALLLAASRVYVALRLGPKGVVIATALASVSAIWGTAQGGGPFAGPTLHARLFFLQINMSVVAATLLILAAAMVERQQAAAQGERRRREAALLAALAQSLSASLDLETVLQRVVTGAQDLCGSAQVGVALRDPDSEVLLDRAAVGAPQRAAAGLRIEPGQGVGEYVLRTGRPWRTAPSAAEARCSPEERVEASAGEPLAVVAVPILIGARVEGVLYAANPAARPFTAQDEESLGRLAAQAAMALHNAQLYRQVQAELVERRKAEARLSASLHEKEVLLKEIHHRVKNNLQIISSLLSLQAEAIADPALLRQFQGSQDRIRSMALVHETLYQAPDLAQLDMARYLHTLSTQLLHAYATEPPRLDVRLQVEPLWLDLEQAVPCGLIVNELLTNACKYAFPAGQAGVVHVQLQRRTAQQATLVVRDTGVGFPADLAFPQTATLGLQLVGLLTEQLGGTITLERTHGTTFTLTFPVRTSEGAVAHVSV